MKLNLLKASFDLITLGQSYNYFVDLVKRGNNMQKKAKRKDMSASERKKGRNDDVQVRLYNANRIQVASVCYRLAVVSWSVGGGVMSSRLHFMMLVSTKKTPTLQSFVKFAKH